ncbi:MAG TPA: hypothetical protein VK993_03120, partial [Chthoniobacterales bacterium]|nr:hypothetical protein [Chthoniobacterales bacterium]
MFNLKVYAADAGAALTGRLSPPRIALVFFLGYASLAFGYSLTIGPLRGPDERNHFLRSYQISEGRFATAYRAGDGWVGDDLPASLARLSAALEDHKVHRIEPSQWSAARALRLAP